MLSKFTNAAVPLGKRSKLKSRSQYRSLFNCAKLFKYLEEKVVIVIDQAENLTHTVTFSTFFGIKKRKTKTASIVSLVQNYLFTCMSLVYKHSVTKDF